MSVWLLLFIPIIISVTALLIFKHKLVWWEMLLPVVAGVICIVIMNGIFISSSTSDTEYLTEYPIEARFYEKWDEYIHETCSDTSCDTDGNCTTTYYDCSYVRYHSEYWVMIMNTGTSRSITKSYYDYLVKLWDRTPKFVDMNRDYHSYDGDMYYVKWTGKFEHVKPYTFSQSYKNKPQAAKTVFKFKELDSIERVGLIDYPKIENGIQINCIGCSKNDDRILQIQNALLGRRKQIKIFIIVYDNKSVEISERQKIYWKGGNKNELVICTDGDFDWAKSFSWMDDKNLEANVDQLFMDKTIPMTQKIMELDDMVNEYWDRKEFEDFEYIKISLTNSQLIWIFIVVSIVSIGLVIFGIMNEIEQDDGKQRYNRFYRRRY